MNDKGEIRYLKPGENPSPKEIIVAAEAVLKAATVEERKAYHTNHTQKMEKAKKRKKAKAAKKNRLRNGRKR